MVKFLQHGLTVPLKEKKCDLTFEGKHNTVKKVSNFPVPDTL
jgi:hypothetical protein